MAEAEKERGKQLTRTYLLTTYLHEAVAKFFISKQVFAIRFYNISVQLSIAAGQILTGYQEHLQGIYA